MESDTTHLKTVEHVDQMDTLLTVHEVSEILRVPVSWVYERTRNRSIPMCKFGRHVRIPRKQLISWVEKKQTTMVR